ncbi:MAG TPA: hypothetical protein VKV37_11910 [Ktedonobacteraceae bacterium]|nr:hypothetical protein [Ktedonobacteraceae bacterium]
MHTLHKQQSSIEADNRETETTLSPLYRQWPQLGQELVVLEHLPATTPDGQKRPCSEQEKQERQAAIRRALIRQVYREEDVYSPALRYLAFLVVKKGRAGVIVGNPYVIERRGRKRELPYTGLEGYYAGSERTAQRPGLTAEEIIQEEAGIGEALLQSLKHHAIEEDAWTEFTHLKRILAGATPDEEDLQTLRILWGTVISRLHVRVYQNPEFELTLTEQIKQMEQLLSGMQARTEEERCLRSALEEECTRLRQNYQCLSQEEQEQEQQERQRRERIRTSRLEEFHRFREETYKLILEQEKGRYTLGVQDSSFEGATITETIALPAIADRRTYPPIHVHLAPRQVEGYLFLAQLGELGGDPLVRSMLIS